MMQKEDFSLGGEQSGHIIIRKYAATGDGILTAMMLCEEVCDQKITLSMLKSGLNIYPQITRNIPVRDKDRVFSDSSVISAYESVKRDIADKGRALLRKSGTEPVVRIMIESETEELCSCYADRIRNAIEGGGHTVD
jgi:phosphoglucosamine mutase